MLKNVAYSDEELVRIAHQNYVTLQRHCKTLQMEGYWNQPQQLLHQKIEETLDWYVQSLLLLFALQNGEIEGEQKEFLQNLTDTDPLAVLTKGSRQEVICAARKFLTAPPILLQLFALRDREKQSHITAMFVNTIVNIIIAMSYLEKRQGEGAVLYMRQYFTQIAAFLSDDLQYLKELDERYVFRKISSSTFETGYRQEETKMPNGKITADAQEPAEKKLANENAAAVPPVREKLAPEEIAAETAKAKLALEQARDAKHALAAEELLQQLNEMVGLDTVKEEMRSLVNLIKVRKMRSNYNMPQMEMSYHMVFAGNAGTGKTTVARLVAKIYKELGVLSKGTFVETDRAGLVAGYLGQTAMKVKEVVERAKGGVLFIDEAYALTSRDAGDDYGIEAIDTLVKEMEDNRNDLVVIVAGYRKEMERFLKSNTGLISRFNKFIDFPDYSNDQLVEIMQKMAEKSQMTMEEGAVEQIRKQLERLQGRQRLDFGNARGIRNAFERIVMNQANRLVELKEPPSLEQLRQIRIEDVSF